MKSEFKKLCFSNFSRCEILRLMEGKDSANTQKAIKNDVASLFVFQLEVSADKLPLKNSQKLSRLELSHSLFFLFFVSVAIKQKTYLMSCPSGNH